MTQVNNKRAYTRLMTADYVKLMCDYARVINFRIIIIITIIEVLATFTTFHYNFM